jgi:dimeric dUTPase (all-alpha-NTP-PPase superfamily)
VNDRLQEMLDAQRSLQELINGYTLESQTDEQRIANIKENVLALSAELFGEVLGEIGWKSWATSRHINREPLKKELVDVLHFFMNLVLYAGMTADELYEGYRKKRAVNERRQRDGYDGVSTKCPGCGRALEDVIISMSVNDDETVSYFCACLRELEPELARRFVGAS